MDRGNNLGASDAWRVKFALNDSHQEAGADDDGDGNC